MNSQQEETERHNTNAEREFWQNTNAKHSRSKVAFGKTNKVGVKDTTPELKPNTNEFISLRRVKKNTRNVERAIRHNQKG